MAGRARKCQFCEVIVPKEESMNMVLHIHVVESSGRKKNKYYHQECYPKFLAREAFIIKEKKEQDELDAVVKSIHGLTQPLPHRYWERVQDMRNGTNRYQKKYKKHYKKGVPYHVLKEAYLLAKDGIEWSKLSKNFKDTFEELIYGLSIAHSKINDADKKITRTKEFTKRAEESEKTMLKDMVELENREVKYVKKKHVDDISHILGND